MDEDTRAALEQASHVQTAAGLLFYEPAHPVSFGPQILVREGDRLRLRLWAEPGPSGARLHVELDGREIGLSDPIETSSRAALELELRAFLGALTPPLWALPVRAPKDRSSIPRPKKTAGSLAARRAAVSPSPSPSPPTVAPGGSRTPTA